MDEELAKNVLLQYLQTVEKEEIGEEDIDIESYDQYGLPILSIGRREYAVGDDEDADTAALEYIKDSAWAFNADFVAGFIGDYDLVPAIQALNEKCEDGNKGMLSMIKLGGTIEEFADEAISADGRGHFLSGYDGEEIEFRYYQFEKGRWVYEDTYYIYRIN